MSTGVKTNAPAEEIHSPRLAAAPHVMAAPEAPFDLDELEELLRTQGQPQEGPQTPRTASPAPEANPPISAEPTKEEIKAEAPSRTTNASRNRKRLNDTSSAARLERRTKPRDDISDPDARERVESSRMAPPHWLANFKIRSTPEERAEDLSAGLLRAIEEKSTARSDNVPQLIFFFLNRLADPDLAKFIPGAIQNAVNGRMIGENNLRYVNNLLHTVEWHRGEFGAPKGERLRIMFGLWETLKEAAPVLRSAGERTLMINREWVPLQSILLDMDLRSPATARPAARPLRRDWLPKNE